MYVRTLMHVVLFSHHVTAKTQRCLSESFCVVAPQGFIAETNTAILSPDTPSIREEVAQLGMGPIWNVHEADAAAPLGKIIPQRIPLVWVLSSFY